MSAGVAVFGTEGRAEGVDVTQRGTLVFNVQLSRHGQEGFLAEKVFFEVDEIAALHKWQFFGIFVQNCCDLEHLTCTLAVTGGDDGGVDVEEPVPVEEFVSGLCEGITNTCNASEQFSSRPQMRNCPQCLQRDDSLAS